MKCIFVLSSMAVLMLANLPRQCVCGFSFQKVSLRRGQKVNQGYTQIYGASADRCAGACGSDDMCKSISYRSRDNVCLLSDYHPDDPFIQNKIINDGDWTIYTKDSCPQGWILYNRSCYLSVREEMDWVEAEKNCQKLGGHLATFENQAENVYVSRLMQTYHWIGLNDREKEGTYVWVADGSPLTFSSWYPHQHRDLEDCIAIGYSSISPHVWHDVDCIYEFMSVCEI